MKTWHKLTIAGSGIAAAAVHYLPQLQAVIYRFH